jgi:hypothetical protein
VNYEYNVTPFPVDQTAAIEHNPLPIHRRISLQRAETLRTSQACEKPKMRLSVFLILRIPSRELPINYRDNLTVAHDEIARAEVCVEKRRFNIERV